MEEIKNNFNGIGVVGRIFIHSITIVMAASITILMTMSKKYLVDFQHGMRIVSV